MGGVLPPGRHHERRVGADRAREQRQAVAPREAAHRRVRREVARLEVEPIVDGPVVKGRAMADERVFVLYEEVPEVVMRPVPYAQARLIIETETDHVEVIGDVRKEVVDYVELPAEISEAPGAGAVRTS